MCLPGEATLIKMCSASFGGAPRFTAHAELRLSPAVVICPKIFAAFGTSRRLFQRTLRGTSPSRLELLRILTILRIQVPFPHAISLLTNDIPSCYSEGEGCRKASPAW